MMDQANSLKMEAMQAQREGRLAGTVPIYFISNAYAESVELLTKAIKSNPKSGILYGSRGQVLLEMKKPNAAIRDCDIAISKNPDSAKPYKVRAKAHRVLGHYEQALKDIQLGQKVICCSCISDIWKVGF
jgi:suppressor of tumorigenicity protein 13